MTLRRKQRMRLHIIRAGSYFLDLIPKVQITKGKVGKLDCAKIKSFVHQKKLSTE